MTKLYVPMLLLAANSHSTPTPPSDPGSFEGGDPVLTSRDAKMIFVNTPSNTTQIWRTTGVPPYEFLYSEDFPLHIYDGTTGVYGLSYDGSAVLLSGGTNPLYRYADGAWTTDASFPDLTGNGAVISGDGTVVASLQDDSGSRFLKVYQYATGTWSLIQTLDVTSQNPAYVTNINNDGTVILMQSDQLAEQSGYGVVNILVFTGAVGSTAFTNAITPDSGFFIIGGSNTWIMNGIGSNIVVRQDSLDNGTGPSNQTKIYVYTDNGATINASFYIDADSTLQPSLSLDGEYVVIAAPGPYLTSPAALRRYQAPWIDAPEYFDLSTQVYSYATGTSNFAEFSVYEYASSSDFVGAIHAWNPQGEDDHYADGATYYQSSPSGFRQFVIDSGQMQVYKNVGDGSASFSYEADFPMNVDERNIATFGISDTGLRVLDITRGLEGTTAQSDLYEFNGTSWSIIHSFYSDVDQATLSGDGTVAFFRRNTGDICINQEVSGTWTEVQTFPAPATNAWPQGVSNDGKAFLVWYYYSNESTPAPGIRIYLYTGNVGSAVLTNTFDDVEGHTIVDARMSSIGTIAILAADGLVYGSPIAPMTQFYLYIFDNTATQIAKITIPLELDISYDFFQFSFAYDGNSVLLSGKQSDTAYPNRTTYKFESPWIPQTQQAYIPVRPMTYALNHNLSEFGDFSVYTANTDGIYTNTERNFIHEWPIPNPTDSYTHIFYDHAPVLQSYVDENDGGFYYAVIPFDWAAETTANKDGLLVSFDSSSATDSPEYPSGPQHMRFVITNYTAQDAYDAKQFVIDTAKTGGGFWGIQYFEFYYGDQQLVFNAPSGTGRYYVINAIRVPSGLVFNMERNDGSADAPDTPTTFFGSANGDGTHADFTWDPDPSADSFNLYGELAPATGAPPSLLTSFTGTSGSLDVGGLGLSGYEIFYAIKAVKGSSMSGYSNEVSVTVSGGGGGGGGGGSVPYDEAFVASTTPPDGGYMFNAFYDSNYAKMLICGGTSSFDTTTRQVFISSDEGDTWSWMNISSYWGGTAPSKNFLPTACATDNSGNWVLGGLAFTGTTPSVSAIIMKSSNAGSTWTVIDIGAAVGLSVPINGVADIKYDSVNGKWWFITGGDGQEPTSGAYIISSSDLSSFTLSHTMNAANIAYSTGFGGGLFVAPHGNTIYTCARATSSPTTTYTAWSTDNGASWTDTGTQFGSSGVSAFFYSTTMAKFLALSTGSGTSDMSAVGIYSVDGTTGTWTFVSARTDLEYAYDSGSTLYFTGSASSVTAIWTTTDLTTFTHRIGAAPLGNDAVSAIAAGTTHVAVVGFASANSARAPL